MLTSALSLYSTVEYLIELQELSLPRSTEKSSQLEKYLAAATDYLGCSPEGGTADALARTKKSVRDCFTKYVENVR